MKMTLKLATILLAVYAWTTTQAQVVPAATGPSGLPVIGNMSYSMRYSQAAFLYGGSEGNPVSSILSADVNYVHPNTRLPFNLSYGGGYMWSIAGQSLGTGVFQHLFVSQGLVQRRWNILASENVSYTPEAPITGFSGVAGTGEPIGTSGTSPASGQSILTINTRTLSNAANLELGYNLNYATTLNVGGGWQLLRFPDGNGMDSEGEQANVGITRRLDARNSIAGQYMFSHFSYSASSYDGGVAGSFDTNALTVDYQRSWNRQLNTNISVGPQWTSGSDSSLVPPTKTIMVNAAIDYQFKAESANLGYNHGINGGAGYLPGATVDTVTGGLSRLFERTLTIGITGSYERTAALENVGGASDARFGGAQSAMQLGPYFSVFAGYTAIDQSTNLAPQTNVLNQLYQVISFGVAYSSREARRR